MKVLLAWPFFYPEVGAASVRGQAFAKYMSEEGAKVEIFAPRTPDLNEDYMFNGCPVHRVPSYANMRRQSFFLGLLYFPLSVLKSVRKIKEIKADVVVSSTPGVIPPLGVFLATKILAIPHIYDIRDTWKMESYMHEGSIRNKVKIWIERLTCRGSSLVFAVSPALKKSIVDQHRLNSSKVKVVYNGVEPDSLKDWQSASKSLDLIHVGSPRKYYDTLRFFKEVLGKLISEVPDIKLVYVGIDSEDPYVQKVIEYVEKHNLQENVGFVPVIPHSTVQSWIRKSRIGLHTSTSSKVYGPGIGVKMLEYLAGGIPVVSYGQTGTEQARFIERNGVGMCTADPEEFVSYVKRVLADEVARERLGKICRDVAKNFDRRKIVKECYAKCILPLVSSSPSKEGCWAT